MNRGIFVNLVLKFYYRKQISKLNTPSYKIGLYAGVMIWVCVAARDLD